MTKNGRKTVGGNGVQTDNFKRARAKARVKTQFSSTNQPANRGRLPKWVNTIKSIPKDAQEKIYARLYEAMLCSSKDDARAILDASSEELGEYGFVLQVAARGLSGKDGMNTLSQILDRIFGKPIQPQVDLTDDQETKDAFIKGVFTP